ncbi:hypothetical protein Xmau_01322 [Xenorhabdus mauleonii]|uniref:Uncharacterized protein n=2 Tax=Xenorhabdus mauleonii TaxID=351675 RepID=A0A1I3KQI0_9GAMM|nr:hypothetical protein Xmau_01322 [Xenorhabdus mauleonii]SFI74375.1 hypothetical protein SAMN05421680_103151 [Xenorhabdus mauleonii]
MRLLFCHSADKEGWFAGSFAERFSRLLPEVIIEAYLGEVETSEIIRNVYASSTKHSQPNANYHIDYQKDYQGKYIGKGIKQTLVADFEPSYTAKIMYPTNSIDVDERTRFVTGIQRLEAQFETCDPVSIKDMLSSRLFFCNGQSSRNINDFLDK